MRVPHSLLCNEFIGLDLYYVYRETVVGLKQYKQAEEYLASAKWALAKAPASREALEIGAKLAHNLGLLYLSRGQLQDAVHHLSQAILDAAQLDGVYSPRVGSSYFQLGQTFFAGGQIAKATSAFNQVLQLWGKYFAFQLINETSAESISGGLGT
jgi:tetratricopeptide (TPR) repeat protein